MHSRCDNGNVNYIRVEPHSHKKASNTVGKEKPPVNTGGGLTSLLNSILPKGLDFGDILLFLVLFLLYVETKDEEFLIILIVSAFTFISS